MSSKVIAGLADKLSEIMGQVEHHQTSLVQLEEQKVHLLATMALFNPNFDLTKLKTKRVVNRPAAPVAPAPAPAVTPVEPVTPDA